jgi:hypothetical protein
MNPSVWDSHRAWDVWSVYQPKYPTLMFGSTPPRVPAFNGP